MRGRRDAVRVYLVSGSGIRDPGFGFRASGFGFRASGFGFRVSGFGLRVSGFGLRVSGFGSRVSGVLGGEARGGAGLLGGHASTQGRVQGHEAVLRSSPISRPLMA